MKYLSQSSPTNKTYTYKRAWPTALKAAAKAAGYGPNFNVPTDVKLDASEMDKARAVESGSKLFKQQCFALKAAAKRATTKATVTSVGGTLDPRMLKMLQERGHHVTRKGKVLSGKAMKAAMQQTTVAELYPRWLEAHPNQSKKDAKDRGRYWSEWLSCLGNDLPATAEAVRACENAFDAWQDQMYARQCSTASVARARNSVMGVLRWADLQLRLGLRIQLRPLPKHTPKTKPTLSPTEQVRLLEEVVLSDGPTAALIPIMLAGGVMPSEIGRLDPEEAVRTLSSATPYVTIGAEGVVKKEARRRIVPLPWSAEVLQAVIRHLPTAIVRANTTTNPSAVVNKWLRQRDFNATGHSLRHTMQAAASASMANPLALARIGGWSGAGLNTTMLTYGAGVDDSELVQSLMAESRRWFKHCVPDAGHGLRLVAGDALLRE